MCHSFLKGDTITKKCDFRVNLMNESDEDYSINIIKSEHHSKKGFFDCFLKCFFALRLKKNISLI